MSAAATKKRLAVQRELLQRAREEAALAVEKAQRMARRFLVVDSPGPFDGAFEPPDDGKD